MCLPGTSGSLLLLGMIVSSLPIEGEAWDFIIFYGRI
jgi:hypothetical protein